MTQIKPVWATFCDCSKMGLRHNTRVVTALTTATTAAPGWTSAAGGDHHRGMRVRPAMGSDAEAIQRLYNELVPGDRNIHVDPERVETLRSDPHNRLLVLEVDGMACGTAFLTVCLDSMYGFHPFGVVENVIVASTHRGRGLGRLLMSAVEEQARASGCTKLMLLSATTRVDAHSFFAHVGFDGEKKRGFVKYLNRTPPLRSTD